MKKTSILLGVGLGVMAFSMTWSSTRLDAQTPGGGTASLGDNVTVIVPVDALPNFNATLVITGPAKAPKAVGNCTDRGSVVSDPGLVGAAGMPIQVAFYDADVVPRTQVDNLWTEGKPSGKTEVAIIFPGYTAFKTLQTGWHLGSGRDGGKCGPGYQVIVEHIVAGAPGGAAGVVNRAFQAKK